MHPKINHIKLVQWEGHSILQTYQFSTSHFSIKREQRQERKAKCAHAHTVCTEDVNYIDLVQEGILTLRNPSAFHEFS